MLLSHQRAYREFPAWWVRAALERKGLEVAKFDVFSGKVGTDYVHKQLTWAKVEATKVGAIAPELSKGLLDHIVALRKAADADEKLSTGGVRLGGSYCLAAKKLSNALSNGTCAQR